MRAHVVQERSQIQNEQPPSALPPQRLSPARPSRRRGASALRDRRLNALVPTASPRPSFVPRTNRFPPSAPAPWYRRATARWLADTTAPHASHSVREQARPITRRAESKSRPRGTAIRLGTSVGPAYK